MDTVHKHHIWKHSEIKSVAVLHRFYSAASVCILREQHYFGGKRTIAIVSIRRYCAEDPAPTCSMGKLGSLPHTEFTIAKAAKSKLGDYATIQLRKWHSVICGIRSYRNVAGNFPSQSRTYVTCTKYTYTHNIHSNTDADSTSG